MTRREILKHRIIHNITQTAFLLTPERVLDASIIADKLVSDLSSDEVGDLITKLTEVLVLYTPEAPNKPDYKLQ